MRTRRLSVANFHRKTVRAVGCGEPASVLARILQPPACKKTRCTIALCLTLPDSRQLPYSSYSDGNKISLHHHLHSPTTLRSRPGASKECFANSK